ncbi:MAG: ribosome small subunit-dependent GTPase A [Treponema sp.]|jgi:ribosome biogenesis GTPase|nr:ribosome small subunit-dependent GTPase A [Treponema sp.]
MSIVAAGMVLCGSNNVFDVECSDGIIRRCSIKGKKLKDSGGNTTGYYNPLAPGDTVDIESASPDDFQAQIRALRPRKNAFVRWNLKGRAPQILAANVDYVVLVTTPDEPPFRPRFIDRALVQAEHDGVTPLIASNKCDLPFSAGMEERLSLWQSLGYRTLRASAKSGAGLAELKEILSGKLSVFAGQSGVGKSSLINALGTARSQKTGKLSEKYNRGNHTTSKGVLLRLGDMAIIDTPGVRRFIPFGIEPGELAWYFPEMRPLAGQCAFGLSCSHTVETGCAVLEALKAGRLDKERYESWRRMYAGLETGDWGD